MTPADVRPANAAGWADALRRGLLAFVAMAGLGQALGLAAWALGAPGIALGDALRIGWLEFGAFHHVEIEAEGSVAVGAGAEPAPASFAVGVALLSATALAGWLLFRAGRAVAERAGGGTLARGLHGAKVAIGYALPALPLALLVDARVAVALGEVVAVEQRLRLSAWQAVASPFAIAALAGALGGLRSAFDRDPARLRLLAAAAAGGWRMLLLALGLSYGGLFLAGVVQPDEPVALLTPASARYYRETFARPEVGVVVLAHHVGLAPNEAAWTLVPAMGGCDGAWGDERADFLCYGRFPGSLELLPPGVFPLIDPVGLRFERAPVGYLLFLLVPTVATVLGGRRAAERIGTRGRAAVLAGALSGLAFAALVAVAAALSLVTVRYELGTDLAGGLVVGPVAPTGALLALLWGIGGGAAGAASFRRPASAGSRAGTPPR